jgi:naphthoate synthase
VLQVMCDLTIAKSAVFRQVGPMMGSFDAGYGTWYLEDLVGKKKAKELWFMNEVERARSARDRSSSTRWCPTTGSRKNAQDGARNRRARRIRARVAVAALPRAIPALGGLGRISHDLYCGLSRQRGIAGARRGISRKTQTRP